MRSDAIELSSSYSNTDVSTMRSKLMLFILLQRIAWIANSVTPSSSFLLHRAYFCCDPHPSLRSLDFVLCMRSCQSGCSLTMNSAGQQPQPDVSLRDTRAGWRDRWQTRLQKRFRKGMKENNGGPD
jgi:hypothetical protein